MSWNAWLILAAVCLTGAMSPGPSLLVVVRTTLSGGSTAGVLLSLSHALAVGLYAALVVFGLAYVVTQAPGLMQGLRLAGAAFLLYLAWGAWAGSAQSLVPMTGVAQPSPSIRYGRAVRDGFLTGLLNPKIVFWFLALFSQFVEQTVSLGHKFGIVLLATGIDAAWYLVVVVLLQRAQKRHGFTTWIERYGGHINRCFAVLLLIIAVRVLL